MCKVTIITPVYNAEKYLESCIDSILTQTHKDIELLLIDDGSTDLSGYICDRYAAEDNRVSVFHKSNGGVSSARNFGIDNANGDWIMFVDGDDWIDTKFIEKMLTKAADEDADIVMCDCYFVTKAKNVYHKMYSWGKQGTHGISEYISTTWTTMWGSLHKRSLYAKTGYKCPLNITYCEDFHLMVRICCEAKVIAKIDEPLYYYRQQDDSIVHNQNKKTEADEQWVYLDIIRFFKDRGLYDIMKRPMAWRSLKACSELLLDRNSFDQFIEINPDKKEYIFNCPAIGTKLKIIAWSLTHGLRPVASMIVGLRNILGR